MIETGGTGDVGRVLRWRGIDPALVRQLGTWLVVLGGAALLPLALHLDPYYTSLLTTGGSYAVAVLGLVVLTGWAGQISLAQGMFFGLGSYCLALGTTEWHWPFLTCLGVGIVVAVAAGAALGMATLRVGTHYLAMVTLSIQLIFSLVLVNWVTVTHGSDGVIGILRPSVGGLSFADSTRYLSLVLGVLVLIAWCVWMLLRSRLGRLMAAVRDDELAAEAAGVATLQIKVLAFSISAALASLGGALFAANLSYISPGSFGFPVAILFLAMALIGGSRSVMGACCGAFLLVLVPQWLQFLGSVYYAIYGLVIVGVIIYMPDGAAGFVVAQWRRWAPARKLAPPRSFHEFKPRTIARTKLLEVRGLEKTFGGVVALDRIDMVIDAGEVHALIGPNGSGKTTLINVLCGVYRATKGTVHLEGVQVGRVPPHRLAEMGVTRTFQLIRLFPTLSVFDNVRVGTAGQWWARRPESDAAWAALRLVGADGFAGEVVSNLPQGHRKLAEIARALTRQPALIMLDEPAGGLNPTEKGELVNVIRTLRALGVTVLIVEHDMSFVRTVADRVTVLDSGRKIAEGPPREVLRDPVVVAAYLGTVGHDSA